jgi:uncharacterized protein YaaN involved in tellurite resistance
MVDPHTIAVYTIALLGVAAFIRSMTAVINASARLIQAVSHSIMTAVAFFKNPDSVAGALSNPPQ